MQRPVYSPSVASLLTVGDGVDEGGEGCERREGGREGGRDGGKEGRWEGGGRENVCVSE